MRSSVRSWICVVLTGLPTVALAADAPPADEVGFVTIFDGKTMNGWDTFYGVPERETPRPDSFVVQDGALYCKGLGDYWLRYKGEKLDNFILRFQFKLTKGANSGICIHTQDTGIPWQTGFEVQWLDDHGKDPDLHTTGSIYDVVNPMYNASKPAGEWNDMEITCRGKQVIVVVNGLKLIDTDFGLLTMPRGKFKTPYNDLPTTGWVTFQDHGMAWWMRNVRLKKLDAGECESKPATRPYCQATGFTTILDGKSMDGWKVINPEGGKVPQDDWVLQDGYLRCRGRTGSTYFRYEKEPLADFVLRGEFRIAPKTNSGIVLRSTKTGQPCYTGFEIQVYDDHGKPPRRHSCGSIYDIVTPMYNTSKPAGEWNSFEITVDGSLVAVVLNGWKIIDTDFSKLTAPRGKFNFAYSDMPRSGYLCFQDHGGMVDYRNIQVKKIPH
ncbi:MAG TPA: DUF1080 domain-containing protein [Phycisphaerae bacterium]|nr:DUF1080 domain-containing protein [Phycisphaerae bacterium]